LFLIIYNEAILQIMSNFMPKKSPPLTEPTAAKLEALGMRLAQRRKTLRVSATVAAEAAGMSRVTLHRIENGEPSVTMTAQEQALWPFGGGT
jgi:DNA-binding XRE family transcriptional regulator